MSSLKSVHIFSLGVCALCTQSIFIREMMALFTGTEFVVGALLAGWLFWVGVGALAGGRVVSRGLRADFRLFVALAVTVAILIPVTTMVIRSGRGLIVRPPGALPPFGPALAFALAVIAPFGFVYGSMYNVASILWREAGGDFGAAISRVYVWEATGSFAGALLFSFVLIAFFSQFEAAVVTGSLLVLSVAVGPRGETVRFRTAAILALVFVAGALSPWLDKKSFEHVYPGYRIERSYSSRYGEVVIASQEEVTSVFVGGGRLFSVPEPERTEEVTHIPLLLASNPRSVLLIGGSLGGGWQEVLKHPSVQRCDCIELDGSLFRAGIGAGAPGALRSEASDTTSAAGRVRFIAGDGRFYLSSGSHRYDVIIVNSPPPVNLQWNRFYTTEFFAIARSSLLPGGLFAFTHPASEDFMSAEQARVLRSCELTLRGVFTHVEVLPGSTVHFVASDAALDPDSIMTRFAERRIDAPFVGAGYLPFRFSRERIGLLAANLGRAGAVPRNTDERPYLPLLELILEGSKAGSSVMTAFKELLAIPAVVPAAVILGLVFIVFAACRAGARARLAVWGVGFASLLLQLLVLLSYQSFSGLLYQAIVFLTAFFMGGSALGARSSMRHREWGAGRLRTIHGAFMALAIALVAWSILLRHVHLSYAVGSLGFLACALSGGFLTGSYYPIVVRTAFAANGTLVPATFYAWDIFGACVGGITGGLIFFPAIGIEGTALCIVLVHAFAAAFLAGRW